MKNIFTATLAVLCALTLSAQVINVDNVDKRVVYTLKYQTDSTNPASVKYDRFILELSDNGSVFKSESRFLKDSLLKTDNPTNVFGIGKSPFSYTIIKEGKRNTMLHFYAVYKFKLQEEENYSWEVLKDQKEILGYKCQKATTNFRGRKYEAWFATDIPVFDGPYKFANLPGLILEVYDTKDHYHFTAESFMRLPKRTVSIDISKYETVTRKQLKEFNEKVKEKPSLIVETPNLKLPQELLDNYDKAQRERNKTWNNPIELIDE